MTECFRFAVSDDAADILEIYTPIALNTPTCFELEAPTLEEMQRRIRTIQEQYPWVVYEKDGKVLGYAYAGPHRARPAYNWSADLSVYVNPSMRRKGLGRALYTALFNILKQQGIVNVYAGVTLPNPGSVGLHEALGFTPVGIYHQVGYKLGKWHDICHFQFSLLDHIQDPAAPLSFPIIKDSSACLEALQDGLHMFQAQLHTQA